MPTPTKFELIQGNEELSSHSGWLFFGDILRGCDFMNQVDRIHLLRRPNPELLHSEILSTMAALLFIGKPDYDAIKLFYDDELLCKSLGLTRVPSAETLRNRLDLAGDCFDNVIRDLSATIVRRFGTVTTCSTGHAPLDIDVTTFDNSGSHKEGVSRTYHKIDGYSPIMAYLGLIGFLINTELRAGKTHSQHDFPRFLADSIRMSRQVTDAPLLVRMDSAHDALDNIKVCIKNKVDYLIKRNNRGGHLNYWLETAKQFGVCEQPRSGKTVWTGSVIKEREGLKLRIVFEVTERITDRHGQLLLIPLLDVNTWWTSLTCKEQDVINLYHDHATSEQFHSEIKSDMGFERLPSGKFATNNLLLLLAMFAYNALRVIGQRSLLISSPNRKEVQRRRIRTILQDIVYVACRVVSHARKWFLSFGRNDRRYPALAELHAFFT
jgi:hypothetical protein